MASEKRFRLVLTMWSPDYPRDDDIEVRFQAYDAMCAAYPAPTSLVDVPTKMMLTCEFRDDDDDEPGDRSSVLAACARHNAKVIDDLDDGKPIVREDWCVVVEMGEPEHSDTIIASIEDGRGSLYLDVTVPVRLAVPTAAERAAFPLPCVVKGGAA